MSSSNDVNKRSFKTAFSSSFLEGYQAGTLKYSYKGVRCIKSPIDLALYLKVMWDLRPETIIEIGSKEGGSALWFDDTSKTFDLNSRVISIDLDPPVIENNTTVSFLRGDVNELNVVLDEALLAQLKHPWLIVEDSAHSYSGCMAALNFFAANMNTGDMLIMEDGVLDDLGLTEQYQGGPNRAIADFLEQNGGVFSIMEELCDFYGYNATYNPNGFLQKT